MLGRITLQARTQRTLQGMNDNLRTLERLEAQVASGKRFQRPSDDPARVARSALLRSQGRRLEGSLETAEVVRNELALTDSALQGVSNVLIRANEIAVQGGSDILGPEERAALAQEAQALLDETLGLANTDLGGRFLFGGTVTDREPFALDAGGPTYSGNDTARVVGVGPAEIQPAPAGAPPFASAGGPPGVLDALTTLRDALSANDPAAVRASLDELEGARGLTTASLGQVGAQQSRLDSAVDGLQARADTVEGLLGDTENADLTESIVDLQLQRTAYERSLEVVSGVLRVSLLDVL